MLLLLIVVVIVVENRLVEIKWDVVVIAIITIVIVNPTLTDIKTLL